MVGTRASDPSLHTHIRRYFGNARTLLMVRLDDHTTDSTAGLSVFREGVVQDRTSPSQVKGNVDMGEVTLSRTRPRKQPIVGNIELGEVTLSRTRPRRRTLAALGPKVVNSQELFQVARNASVNLASAIYQFISGDGKTVVLDVSPQSSSRQINSYRKADELTLSFNWRDLPFDARIIRAILVFHYEGTVSPTSFASGRHSRTPDGATSTGYAIAANGSNLRFIGQCDEISDAHSQGEDMVSLKCRDLTALFLDSQMPKGENKKLALGSTLVEVIKNLMELNPVLQLVDGPLLLLEDGERPPVLQAGTYDRFRVSTQDLHKASRSGNKSRVSVVRRASKGDGEETFWDAITDLCLSHGFQPEIRNGALFIFRPKAFYRNKATFATSPFEENSRAPEDRRDVRRMVYGENIAEMSFQRKLGKVKSPAIKLVSYNPDAKTPKERVVTAVYPPDALKPVTHVQATGKAAQREVRVLQWSGIVDKDLLNVMAQQVYESIGRQELSVRLSTDDLASYRSDPQTDPNDDPDLLSVRAGDPFEVLVTPTQRRTGRLFSLTELNLLAADHSSGQASGRDSVEDYLIAQGFSPNTAQTLTKVLRVANLPNAFRVNQAAVAFDASTGFQIQLDLRDYVRVRSDPDDIAQTRGRVLVGDRTVSGGRAGGGT